METTTFPAQVSTAGRTPRVRPHVEPTSRRTVRFTAQVSTAGRSAR